MRHIAILTFLVVALSALPAHAQDRSRDEAKVHFSEGTALYEQGDYEEALAQFRLGEALYSDPSFDYSIALCFWRLGNIEAAEKHAAAAVAGFAEYQIAEPAARNGAHLIAFRRILKAAEVADDMPEQPVVVATTTTEKPPKARVPAQTWVGGAFTLAGLGLLGWWGVTELSLGGTIDDYEAAAAASDTQSWQALRGEIESKQTTARVLLFTGAGVTAVGGALLIWGLTSSGKGESRATMHITPTGAVMVWKF